MKKNREVKQNTTRYSPTLSVGLSLAQINERIASGNTNTTKATYSKSYISIFINNVCTFFNLLGLICLVALLLTGASLSQFFFVFFYLANITIGIVQEIRAKNCIDKLSIVTIKNVKVLRDGKVEEILPNDIVLDDVILLEMGNQIPTDCNILSGEIEVNESLLTGESVPVKKHVGDLILAGSFIVSGNCTAQAERVGAENYVETLSAKAKQYKKPNSEIMNSLKLIIKVIGFIIVPLATAFMIKSTLVVKTNLPTAVLGAATVVIGMIPAGMFLLTSVALAVGIIKLARHNTLVQDLYSLEMLARVDMLCFDKTGTITDGNMTVEKVIPINDISVEINSVVSSMLSALNDNNQTAIALKNYFGTDKKYDATYTLPFNSSRKFSAVMFQEIGTFAFGAPEFVLSKNEYKKIEEQINLYASKGMRVLVLSNSQKPLVEDFIPTDFSPIALIIIADNVRADVVETIKWFKDNGVSVKVISGDNPITVSEVSKRVGIENADKYVSLEGMSDDQVFSAATEYTIFGRVSPEQKAILIKALKQAGHVTAMTGDGVNDILALKEADCAISVATGSDSARNVSHLVLLDNNFNSMPNVVYEGRRVINNVQCSASLFLMKTLFTMLMGIITLCLPYMQTYPFTASQMIILEVFVIGLPAFVLSLQPNKNRITGRFISYVIKKSLPGALLMVISVAIIEILKKTLGIFSDDVYTTMQVYTIFLSGLINLLIVCKPFTKYRAILFLSSTIIVVGIVLFSIFFGFNFLGFNSFMPISTYWHHALIVPAVTILDIPLAILLNKVFEKI